MKIGIVGLAGSGKSTVFGALTGLAVGTGYTGRSDKTNIGVVKVPDPRVDALAKLYKPKKITYAESTFTDVQGGTGAGLDRAALDAMRNVDALCQVLRAFEGGSGEPANPVGELRDLATETILADLEIVENRVARLEKDRSDPGELAMFRRLEAHLASERSIRDLDLTDAEEHAISSYSFLSRKPLLLVLNVAEDRAAADPPEEVRTVAEARGLGLVVLSAAVEMDIAQMSDEEQREFLDALGFTESARDRFIRCAYELLDLISMLTAGEDECRAWPVRRGSPAPRAAGKIHSDIQRGFIRAEVVGWQDLVELGSEARCREVGKLRVEGKEYVIQDGDVVNFRFNV